MKSQKEHQIVVMLADLFALVIAYGISAYVYLTFIEVNFEFLSNTFTRNLLNFVVVFAVVEVMNRNNSKFMFRNRLGEFYSVFRNTLIIATLFSVFVFVAGISNTVSRGVTVFTLVLFLILSMTFRLIVRNFYEKEFNTKRLVLVSDKDQTMVSKLINNIHSSRYGRVDAVYGDLDIKSKGKAIRKLSRSDGLIAYASKEIVDEVIFDVDSIFDVNVRRLIDKLQSMGIQITIEVPLVNQFEFSNMQVLNVGDSPLVTFPIINSEVSLIFKRVLDIGVGIIGSFVAVLAILLIGPLIKLESKGPIIFKQIRVGRNGRYFEIYKLRSMGVDAESRKKELMDNNEVEGHMFKMTNDPRVTRIGKLIRSTSIDELPQFFNVLKGDMSVVGTRPPTVEEFKNYMPHHKFRLAMKPGITGMWQVSGRSNITDFEQVVKLDVNYITNFSILLDFIIIGKTFGVVVKKVGSK